MSTSANRKQQTEDRSYLGLLLPLVKDVRTDTMGSQSKRESKRIVLKTLVLKKLQK